MLLEDEQKELLAKFVEAHRSAPKELRGDFLAHETLGTKQAEFVHLRVRGLRFSGNVSDARVLAGAGLLKMFFGSKGSLNSTSCRKESSTTSR